MPLRGAAAPGPAAPRRRQRARRGEGDRLREQILAATERLLIETGDEDAVSIRAVAEAVGVTPPAIYLHFADKRELIFAAGERHFDELLRFVAAAATATEDPVESLRLQGRAYVTFGLEHPEEYRILFMGKPSAAPADRPDERLRRSAAFDHLMAAVGRCMDTGNFAPNDPFAVALGLWAAVHGITALLIAKPAFPWPDRHALVDHILTVQLEGLRRPVRGVQLPASSGPGPAKPPRQQGTRRR